jgi:hypothetical protein
MSCKSTLTFEAAFAGGLRFAGRPAANSAASVHVLWRRTELHIWRSRVLNVKTRSRHELSAQPSKDWQFDAGVNNDGDQGANYQ